MVGLLSFGEKCGYFSLVFAQIVVAAEFPPAPNPFSPLHKRLHQHTFIRT